MTPGVPYLEGLRSCIDAVRITPTAIHWFGEKIFVLPRQLRRVPLEVQTSVTDDVLQSLLYAQFYCPGVARRMDRSEPPVDSGAGRTQHLSAMSLANKGSGWLDSAWSPERVSGDVVTVRKGELRASVRRSGPPPVACDSSGAVLRSKEHLGLSPGFYLARGDANEHAEAARTIRIYWNISASCAPAFIGAVTRTFNAARVPFECKAVSDPSKYDRCDAGVLYLNEADLLKSMPLLDVVHTAVRDGLSHGTPYFTKPLAPGVGLAEDPGNGSSFGVDRCGKLAAGLRAARMSRGVVDRLDIVCSELTASDVLMSAPYLRRASSSSDDPYVGLRLEMGAPKVSTGKVAVPLRPASGSALNASTLHTAERLAADLVQAAVWDGELCTWLGSNLSRGALTVGSLGPDVYSGTAGVALFLGQWACRSEDRLARRTAVAALRHAISCLEEVSPGERSSLYTGHVGVALACVQIGAALEETELCELGLETARQLVGGWDVGDGPVDFLTGRAGGVVGLIELGRLLQEPDFHQAALDLGSTILSQAVRSERGTYWKPAAEPGDIGLTGLSHGAGGVAMGLIALAAAVGDRDFLEAGFDALRYEDSWYVAAASNWPDLRGIREWRAAPPTTCLEYWCHGAPGIALGRMVAARVSESWRPSADRALGTTMAAARRWVNTEGHDYSLCHGMSGLAEILLEGARGGFLPGGALAATASLIFDRGSRYADDVGGWPTGLAVSASNPGFMLGRAGIGYACLRHAWPSTPSWAAPVSKEIVGQLAST